MTCPTCSKVVDQPLSESVMGRIHGGIRERASERFAGATKRLPGCPEQGDSVHEGAGNWDDLNDANGEGWKRSRRAVPAALRDGELKVRPAHDARRWMDAFRDSRV